MKAALLAIQREEAPAARFYLQRAETLRQGDSQVQAAAAQLASLDRTSSTTLPLALPAATQAGTPGR